MTVSIANTWSSPFSVLPGFSYSYPLGSSTALPVANTSGNWLIAVATWQSPGEFVTTMAFGDDAGNYWTPLGAPAGTSSPAGTVRSAIWAAPYAAAAGAVFCSPSDWCPAFAVLVLEVAGMSPGLALASVDTSWANAATSASVALPAPASQVLAIACAGSDLNTATVTMSGAGWTALPVVASTDGSDHLADITLTSGYQVTSGATSASWSSTASLDLGACAVALAVTQAAPAGPTQGWPYVQFEAAFGAGLQTPWDQLTWTDLTTRYRGFSGTRGKQYELDSVQASSSPLTLSNNDGALTPAYGSSPYYLGISGWTGRNGATLALSRAYAWTGPASMLMAPDGATSGTYAESAQCPATASTSGYAASAAVYSPQGWSTVAVAIRWYNSGGTFISSSAGTGVAATAGQWCYPQVSASSPAGAAFATLALTVNGTAPASTLFWWDFAQLTNPAGSVINSNSVFPDGVDVYTPARLSFTWLARRYVQWRGFVERWPSQLSAARYTTANATATDVYAALTSQQPTVVAGEIDNDDPWGYWQLSDAAGSTMAANGSTGAAGPLNLVESKFGSGPTGTAVFGANSGAFAGLPGGTTWQQSGLNSGSTDMTHGFCLQTTATTATPPVSAGLTIEAWFMFASGAQPNGKLVIWSLQSSVGPVAQLWGNTDGTAPSGAGLYVSVTDKGTRAVTSTRIAAGVNSPAWTHVTVTLTSTTWSALFDAGSATLLVSSGSANLGNWQWITFGGTADRISTGGMSNLSLAGLAVFPRALTQTRVVGHYVAAVSGIGGDTASRKVNRLLSYAGMLVPRRLGASADSLAAATDIQGQAVASNVINAANSNAGLLYADRAGYLAMDTRSARWNRAVAWNAGEVAGAILNANWDFETGISPWASGGGGVTVAQSSAASFTGTSAMLVTPSAGASSAVAEKDPVFASTAYTATAQLMSPGGWASGGRLQVTWYNAALGVISTSTGTAVPLNAGQWTPVTISATSPAGAAYATLITSLTGSPTSSNTYYADLAQLVLPGEIPYLGDFSPDFDPSQVVNDVTLSQYGGVTVKASSPTSIAQYGDRTFQATTYLTDPDVVTDQANWTLATYDQPSPRIAQFTVDCAANPYAWQFVLSTDVGTVVQLSRRLQGTQTVIQSPFIIQSVAPTNGPGVFQVKYVATPYVLGALATNDPVRGLPNGLNTVAWLRGGADRCSSRPASPSAPGPSAPPRSSPPHCSALTSPPRYGSSRPRRWRSSPSRPAPCRWRPGRGSP